MIVDLTTKVSSEQLSKWLEKSEEKHILTGHIGTHLDTYKKTDIALKYFKSEGVLLDVSDVCEQREVDLCDILNIDIPANSFVIFRTARIERCTYGSTEYFAEHPQLSHELIAWLIDRQIRFIGVDCSGIRRGTEHETADTLCEASGIYVIENLCNLDKLIVPKFTVYTMWLDDPTMTGLKCRVIAEY